MTPKKVLIVARPSEALDLVVARLRDAACLVEFAMTGDEGLRSAATLSPEIIVIDDGLPDTTPIELTLRLRSVVASTPPPVFLLTVPGQMTTAAATRSDPEPPDRLQGITRLVDQIVGFLHSSHQEGATADRLTDCGLQLDRGRLQEMEVAITHGALAES